MPQKKDKKSLGSSVADIRDNEVTEETMPTSVSRPEEVERK
jgi:hypothetical protein